MRIVAHGIVGSMLDDAAAWAPSLSTCGGKRRVRQSFCPLSAEGSRKGEVEEDDAEVEHSVLDVTAPATDAVVDTASGGLAHT